jgi:5-methylthioadenosine/S-adenosylhomocysteine deaminase
MRRPRRVLLVFVSACILSLFSPTLFAQDLVVSGTVVTPDRIIPKGWVVIKDGHILSILEKAPDDGKVPTIATSGIIFPGFVDLHNHPMYNIFKRWSPGMKFKNRYEWRDNADYISAVGKPGGDLQKKDDQTFCDIDEYVELKALLGGTTSIAGISSRRGFASPVPACVSGLARNLDWASGFYGSGVGGERIENVLGVAPRDLKEVDVRRVSDELSGKKINLLLIHVGEGASSDTESTVEFRALKGLGFLGPQTAIIHGAALGSDDFGQMKLSGTALIWSPRSNMELYGATAGVAEAYRQGVTMALAPDWSPTGSTNTLAELSYASQLSREKLAGLFSDRELFEMSTAIPARIAGIDDKVGSLKEGLYADLFVLAGDASQPYEALAHAKPEDVQLVLVGGVPIFGSEKLLEPLKLKTEPVDVCGKQMYLNSGSLVAGSLAEVTGRLTADLKGYKLNLASLAECRK